MLQKYKRFLLISGIVVFIISTPIYAFMKVVLPDALLERIRSELPDGVELKIDNVSSKLDLAILYEGVQLTTNSQTIEIPVLEIKPILSFKNPVQFLAESFSFQTETSAISASKVEGLVNISKISLHELTIEGKFNNIKSPEDIVLSQGEFVIAGLNSQSQDFDLQANEVKLTLRTPQGPLFLNINNGRAMFRKTDTLSGTIQAQKFDFELVSKDNPNIGKAASAGEAQFNFSFEKPNEQAPWALPIDAVLKKIQTKNGAIFDRFEVQARGQWTGNSLLKCGFGNLISRDLQCGKMTDVLDMSIKLKDENRFLHFFGDGFCVAPDSGCRQTIKAKLESLGTQELFSELMNSGLLSPVLFSVFMGMLMGSPSANYEVEHSIDVSVDGGTIFINEMALF